MKLHADDYEQLRAISNEVSLMHRLSRVLHDALVQEQDQGTIIAFPTLEAAPPNRLRVQSKG